MHTYDYVVKGKENTSVSFMSDFFLSQKNLVETLDHTVGFSYHDASCNVLVFF